MLRNYIIYLIGFTFLVCNIFFFPNITFAVGDSVREKYYDIKTGKLDSAAKEEAKKQKKDELLKEYTQAESEHNQPHFLVKL